MRYKKQGARCGYFTMDLENKAGNKSSPLQSSQITINYDYYLNVYCYPVGKPWIRIIKNKVINANKIYI